MATLFAEPSKAQCAAQPKESELATARSQLETARHEAAHLSQRLSETTSELSLCLEEQVNALPTQLFEQQIKIAIRTQLVEDLYRSKSWRLSAPIRWLGRGGLALCGFLRLAGHFLRTRTLVLHSLDTFELTPTDSRQLVQIHMRGWCFHPFRSQPVTLELRGDARLVAHVPCDLPRPEVAAEFAYAPSRSIAPCCGFDQHVDVPTSVGDVTLCEPLSGTVLARSSLPRASFPKPEREVTAEIPDEGEHSEPGRPQNSHAASVSCSSPRSTARKVLFISHDAHRTGAPILLLELLTWLKANSDLQLEVLLGVDGELRPAFEALSPVLIWNDSAANQNRADHVDRLVARFRQANVGLIYSNTITNGDILARLSELQCPVICHVHELGFWITHRVERQSLEQVQRLTSHYIAVSEAVRRNLLDSLHVGQGGRWACEEIGICGCF
jgi:hypothetical protein